MKLKVFFIFLLLHYTYGLQNGFAKDPVRSNNKTDTVKVLLFSDLHYDPSKSSPNSRDVYNDAKNDASLSLVTNVLQKAHELFPNPAFIVCTGDFLAHNIDAGKAVATESNLAWLFKTNFPDNTKIIPVLGNNDSDGGDYCPPTVEFLKAFVTVWSDRVPGCCVNGQCDFAHSYTNGGRYTVDLPGLSNAVGVAFNSTWVSKSPRNLPDPNLCKNQESHPNEITSLSNDVAQAIISKKQAWLIFHIPPGFTYHEGLKAQWTTPATIDFIKLVAKYGEHIPAIFAAHTHKDEFRVIYDPDEVKKPTGFVHLIPSVVADHGNNPSFQVLEVIPTNGAIKDCITFYLTNFALATNNWTHFKPTWGPEYSFGTQFANAWEQGNHMYNTACLTELIEELEHPGTIRSRFLSYYSVGYLPGSQDVGSNFDMYLGSLRIEDPTKQYFGAH